jgi:hypothetical protein
MNRRSLGIASIVALAIGCATPAAGPERYRLNDASTYWDVVEDDAVLEDLRPRYPEYFEVILDPSKQRLPNLIVLRDDLERVPVDRRNFDALNALAIGYFEINHRAEAQRGESMGYLWGSQRSAQLLAVPWRGYGETDDAALRNAILDFFEDAGTGNKLSSAGTSGRVAPIVESLAKKEQDPQRLARIDQIVRDITARQPTPEPRDR